MNASDIRTRLAGVADSLLTVLTDDQISAVLKTGQAHKTHPLKRLITVNPNEFSHSNEQERGTLQATNMAVQAILDSSGNTSNSLRSLVVRATETAAYENISGALGEIRAWGSLLMAGIPVLVRPTSQKGSDFIVDSLDIEVHSAEMDGDEAKKLDDFLNTKITLKPGQTIASKSISAAPCGAEKPRETAVENIASKFAQIKEKEHQLSGTKPGILWLDLHDAVWWTMGTDHFTPLYTWLQDNYSGGIWLGFYGTSGIPMFEGIHTEMGYSSIIDTMRFDGRFRRSGSKKSKASVVVLARSKFTVIYENPWADHALTEKHWEQLTRLPNLDLSSSWCSWPSLNRTALKARIEDAYDGFRKVREANLARISE